MKIVLSKPKLIANLAKLAQGVGSTHINKCALHFESSGPFTHGGVKHGQKLSASGLGKGVPWSDPTTTYISPLAGTFHDHLHVLIAFDYGAAYDNPLFSSYGRCVMCIVKIFMEQQPTIMITVNPI